MELKKYLNDADSWLLANFRDGEQGREEFSKFMQLVREQQEENEQLKRDKSALKDIISADVKFNENIVK